VLKLELSALLQRYILKAIHNLFLVVVDIHRAVSATAKIHFESNSQPWNKRLAGK
jgi:hypothetical protein